MVGRYSAKETEWRDDRSHLLLLVDHRCRPRPARGWARPRPPRPSRKYGGSMLWGNDGVLPGRNRRLNTTWPMIALISAVIAVGVELFRLVHTPWLDAFRLTLAGALLLGR